MRFGHQAKERAVTVEAPRPADGSDLQRRLAVAVEQLIAGTSRWVLVGQFDDRRPVPLGVDDLDESVRQYALHPATGLQIFESRHQLLSFPPKIALQYRGGPAPSQAPRRPTHPRSCTFRRTVTHRGLFLDKHPASN